MNTPDFSECRVVNIEIVHGCNLRCPHCSLLHEKHEFMDMTTLKQVLGALAGAREDLLVALYLGGEPVLHPEFVALVAATRRAGFGKIRVHTNGSIHRLGLWEMAFDAGLSSVFFSVDGADPEDFERMRAPAKFETVRRNLGECLLAARKRPVEVGVMCLVEEPRPLALNSGLAPLADRLTVTLGRPHVWLGRGTISGASRCAEAPQNPCFFLQNHMVVNVRGEYLPCCLCLNSEAVLGSARALTAREAWEGPIEELRNNQRAGREFAPCSTCERYARP